MQSQNRFLDDIAKLGMGLIGIGAGVCKELRQKIRHKGEHVAQDMDLVTREEFEVVRDMAQKARMDVEDLKKPKKKAAAKKTPTKKKTTAKKRI